MKKIVRLFALTLVLAASFAAAVPSEKVSFMGGGEPTPLCDPDNPNCTIK